MAEIKTSEQPAGGLEQSTDLAESRKDGLQSTAVEPEGSGRAKGHPVEGSPRENDRVGVVSDPDFVGRHD